jgi:hypothetical protein
MSDETAGLTRRLDAIEGVKLAKARYWRGVDICDGDLVRSILAEECELDYRGCCTDPATGRDWLPAMNVVLTGRDKWVADGMSRFGIVSVHQGNQPEITIEDADRASAIWAFTDRMFFPAGAEFATLTGWGHYHDTYVLREDRWQILTTRITRLRVETQGANA